MKFFFHWGWFYQVYVLDLEQEAFPLLTFSDAWSILLSLISWSFVLSFDPTSYSSSCPSSLSKNYQWD
jgi:hypothetical protein